MSKAGEFYNDNFIKLVLLQVILCILLSVLIRETSKNEQELKFSKENLSGGYVSETGYAVFDEADGEYGWLLEVETEEIKKGWYKVRIEYDAGYDDNGFVVQALNEKALNEDIGEEGRPIRLRAGRDSQEVHAWLNESSELRVAILFCGGNSLQIEKILLYQVPDYTPAILLALCLLFLNLEFYEKINLSREELKRRRYVRLGIAGIVLLSSIPLMNEFTVYGHDYEYHIYNMEGIAEGLLSGQFPVKIMPNWWNEFGDGAPLFYASALTYISALVLILGYTIQTAYKFYIVFINLLTAYVAYKCFMKVSRSSRVALLGAFLYTLNLYRLIDIYIRCAVGEYTALTFLPLILLGIYLIEEDGWVYLALGVTGCLQSHMLVCEMSALFFFIFCIINIKWVIKKQVFINFCKAGIFSILWNLWFILPFMNVYGSGAYKIHEYSLNIEGMGIPVSQIFSLYFKDTFGGIYTMGLPLLIGLFIVIVILGVYGKRIFKESKNKKLGILLVITVMFAFLALLLSMDIVPYHKISNIHAIVGKLITMLEFPFRFMGMASLFSVFAIISAIMFWKDGLGEKERKKYDKAGYIIIGTLVMLTLTGISISYWNLLTGDITRKYQSEYYVIESKLGANNKWLPLEADESKLSQELLTSPDVVLSNYKKEYTNIEVFCINKGVEEGYVDVPLFYYPCYKAQDAETGESLELTYGENARIRIILPSEYQGMVLLKVSERKLWRISEVISVFSVLVAVFIVKGNNYKGFRKAIR